MDRQTDLKLCIISSYATQFLVDRGVEGDTEPVFIDTTPRANSGEIFKLGTPYMQSNAGIVEDIGNILGSQTLALDVHGRTGC